VGPSDGLQVVKWRNSLSSAGYRTLTAQSVAIPTELSKFGERNPDKHWIRGL
jgi:hypothetical protein